MATAMPAETKPSLTIQKRFQVPVERVWRAWTEPEAMVHWFGPEGAEVSHAETDVRVGGRFRVIFSEPPDPEIHDVSGVYKEVETKQKLVFTWRWITMPERESLVTVMLRAEGDKTLMIFSHEQFADEEARDGHREGWTGCFERLEAYLWEDAA